jgi:hypothetical protein
MDDSQDLIHCQPPAIEIVGQSVSQNNEAKSNPIRGFRGFSRIARQQSRGREKLLSVASRHLQLKTDD